MSQPDLAKALEVSTEAIKRWEKGEIARALPTLIPKLATVFRMDLSAAEREFVAPNGTPHPTAAENEPADSPAARIGPRTLHLAAVPEIERDWIEAAAARDGALPAQVMLRLVLKGLAAERRERPDDELGYGEAASPRDSTDDPRPKGRKPKRPQK